MIPPVITNKSYGFNQGFISWCEMDFATIHGCQPPLTMSREGSGVQPLFHLRVARHLPLGPVHVFEPSTLFRRLMTRLKKSQGSKSARTRPSAFGAGFRSKALDISWCLSMDESASDSTCFDAEAFHLLFHLFTRFCLQIGNPPDRWLPFGFPLNHPPKSGPLQKRDTPIPVPSLQVDL